MRATRSTVLPQLPDDGRIADQLDALRRLIGQLLAALSTAARSADCFPARWPRETPVPASPASSSSVKLPPILLIISKAPKISPLRPRQRNAQQRARAKAQLSVDMAIDRILLRVFVDALDLARVDDLADNAALVRNSQFTFFDAQGGATDQLMMDAIPEKNAGPLGAQQLSRRFGHLIQQRFHFEMLIPLSGDLEDGFQPSRPPLAAVPRLHLP